MSFRSRYRVGEWVEVRSKEEVLATLDASGALDNLPFMPEMLQYCGKRFQVSASAHKTCDTVNNTGGRRLRDAVHLEGLRCDGAAHGECQARCLIFWKESWLKPAGAPTPSAPRGNARRAAPVCDERRLAASVEQPGSDPADRTWVCQATRLPEATTLLKRWTPRQYIADVRSGNVGLGEALKILFLALVYNLRDLGYGYRLLTWLYDRSHHAFRGCPSPYGEGVIPRGATTPHQELNLQVGEVVRVKPHHEILDTLDTRERNRGLYFDKEMVRYCGKELRVGQRVTQIINESTGKMLRMPTPSIILENAYCTGQYSDRRLLCPRRILPYWREIWLSRVSTAARPAKKEPIRLPMANTVPMKEPIRLPMAKKAGSETT